MLVQNTADLIIISLKMNLSCRKSFGMQLSSQARWTKVLSYREIMVSQCRPSIGAGPNFGSLLWVLEVLTNFQSIAATTAKVDKSIAVGNLLWYLKVGRLLMSDTTYVRHLVSVRPNHRAIVVGLPVVDTPVPFNQANLQTVASNAFKVHTRRGSHSRHCMIHVVWITLPVHYAIVSKVSSNPAHGEGVL